MHLTHLVLKISLLHKWCSPRCKLTKNKVSGLALASCKISSVFLSRHSALQDIWHQTHWEGPGPGSILQVNRVAPMSFLQRKSLQQSPWKFSFLGAAQVGAGSSWLRSPSPTGVQLSLSISIGMASLLPARDSPSPKSPQSESYNFSPDMAMKPCSPRIQMYLLVRIIFTR